MVSLLDWRGGNCGQTVQTQSLWPGSSSFDKNNFNRDWKSVILRDTRFKGHRRSSLSSFASNVFVPSSQVLPLSSTSSSRRRIVSFAIHSGRGGDSWQNHGCARWGIIPDRELAKPLGTKLAVDALFGRRNGTAKFHSPECAQDESIERTEIVHESNTGKRWSQEEYGGGVIVAGGRTLALVLLSVAWLMLLLAGKSPAAAAAEPSSSSGALVTTLRHHAQGLKPQAMQILAVFKDQGLLLTILLGLSAFFSMAETSIMTLWPWKVRELADKEGEEGVFRRLSKDVTRFLTTILIGTTVVNIAATALVTDAATSLFGEAGVTAATGVMTVVILLVTEIAPKSIAVHNATKVARFAVRPVALLSVILYPVGRVVTAMSMTLLRLLGLKSTGATSVSEEELKLMLRGAELSGAIEEEEQDMIEKVLEIKDTFVREVMTPLVDVVAIDAESTLMEFRDYWVKHQYSRTPVFERRVDNIVGIAYAMDMLSYIDYDGEQAKVLKRLTVGRIAHRPAYFVPDSMSVWNLLREFRIRKVHMAIVLNEYGGAVGVVTLEDVVEEIVGEIFDENDSKEEIRKKTGYVVQRADGVFDVDANTHVEDLEEALEVKMAEGPYRYETVSGFVCEAFGYIPRTGDSISVILKKSDSEDNQEGMDEDHQEDNKKEKFQEYKLEILAGNARKVGAVRFQVGKSHVKHDGAAFARSQGGVLGKVRARAAESGEEKGDAMFESEDEFCDVEFMPPETVKVDEYEQPQPLNNGHIVTDSDEEDTVGSDLAGSYEAKIEYGDMDSNGSQGSSSNGSAGKQKPLEERTQRSEGRTQRRRGQSSAGAENRQQRVSNRRKQVEQALAAVKGWGDGQQKDPESETLEDSMN